MWKQINKTTEPDVFRCQTDDITLDLTPNDMPDTWQATIRSDLVGNHALEIVAENEHEAKAKALFRLHILLLAEKQRIDKNIGQTMEHKT